MTLVGVTSWRAADGAVARRARPTTSAASQAVQRLAHGIPVRRIRRELGDGTTKSPRPAIDLPRAPSLPAARRVSIAVMAAVFVLASAAYALAQFRGRGFGIRARARLAPAQFPDGDFVICRLVYTEVRRYGVGWRTDYPLGERNLSIRFSELTRTRVSQRARRIAQPLPGPPDRRPAVLLPLPHGRRHRLDRPQRDRRRAAARVPAEGRVPVDRRPLGFRGVGGLDSRARESVPSRRVPDRGSDAGRSDLQDAVRGAEMPQIPNIGYWRRSGGDTSEQGADSAVPHFYVVRDHHGRIMLAMTHNTDIADAFEREADDPVFFARFSPQRLCAGDQRAALRADPLVTGH